jgi:hypothetical protein
MKRHTTQRMFILVVIMMVVFVFTMRRRESYNPWFPWNWFKKPEPPRTMPGPEPPRPMPGPKSGPEPSPYPLRRKMPEPGPREPPRPIPEARIPEYRMGQQAFEVVRASRRSLSPEVRMQSI